MAESRQELRSEWGRAKIEKHEAWAKLHKTAEVFERTSVEESRLDRACEEVDAEEARFREIQDEFGRQVQLPRNQLETVQQSVSFR